MMKGHVMCCRAAHRLSTQSNVLTEYNQAQLSLCDVKD